MANLGVAWLVVWILPAFGAFPPLPDYLQFWLLMALGALVFFPTTLLTKPEEMDHLIRYYLQTRPLGWWGPVHREAVRRGLIVEGASAGVSGGIGGTAFSAKGLVPKRPFIKRRWTAAEAEEWTREDWIVIALSPVVMAAFMIGVAALLLFQPFGLSLTVAAVLGTGLIYWIIDPKLRAVSADYEQRQAAYLEDLERGVRWEKDAVGKGGSGQNTHEDAGRGAPEADDRGGR
jgi:hypothetical protein